MVVLLRVDHLRLTLRVASDLCCGGIVRRFVRCLILSVVVVLEC